MKRLLGAADYFYSKHVAEALIVKIIQERHIVYKVPVPDSSTPEVETSADNSNLQPPPPPPP